MIVDLMGQSTGLVTGLIGMSDWSVQLAASTVHSVADSASTQAASGGLIDWTSRKLREFRILILLAVWVFVAGMVGFVYARTKGSWGATLAAIILGAVVLAGVHNMDALQGNVGAEINSAPAIHGIAHL
ncbi:MAG TPA: hypothetical protein VEX15_10155 [Nocardioidaceae bacterium]|nr:hypothetical protein [Nocardioidaceae bacterium]